MKSIQDVQVGPPNGTGAAFASNALLHELWDVRLDRPLNRRSVLLGLELSTLDEIESSDVGTKNVLRLLRFGERHGWWSHLFGIAQRYPDGRPDDDGDGVPTIPPRSASSSGSTGVGCRPDHTASRSGTSSAPSGPPRSRAGTPTCRSATRRTAS